MRAEYTVKIGDVFYKAGDEIPETKEVKAAETVKAVEPPVSKEVEEAKTPKEDAKPSKRQYSRRK